MAANVRYRSTFYNTTASGSGNRTGILEILDMEAVAGITQFQSHVPDESFQGLTHDFRPGVYPTTLRFDMALRPTPKTIMGVTYGATAGFVDDIIDADEGRFLARLTIDGVVEFVGPIIYDQCSYEDADIPWLRITAVDGMARWSTEDYISEIGQIKYYSRTRKSFTYDPLPLSYDGPLIGGAYTLVEHIVENSPTNVGDGVLYTATTTWAWRELYSKTAPAGAGWVYQGNARYTIALTYTNEVITELVDSKYHLTRDIDDDHHRTLIEYIIRAIALTRMGGEYADPAVMFDTASAWYETRMANFDDDPFTMMRVHEEPLIGRTWQEAMQIICRNFFLRIYYSAGRYHIEQISRRLENNFTRWIYKADGTSAGAAETTDLDINFNTYPIQPATGGEFHHLPAFRSVEATIRLDQSDLLKGVRWDNGSMGMKYLGKIKRGTGTQVMRVTTTQSITSTFDPAVLSILSPSVVNNLCKHTVRIYTQIRLTNIALGTVYYLNPDGNNGVWDVDPYSFERTVNFGTPGSIYSADAYGHLLKNTLILKSDDIPDPEDAMYDVHMSITFGIEWATPAAQNMWEVLNPTKHWHILSSDPDGTPSPLSGTLWLNSMRFYSDTSTDPWVESSDTIAQDKVYSIDNSVDNSIRVKIECAWGDTNQFTKAVQILDGDGNWVHSAGWSIGGAGDPVELLTLLVTEVMALRLKPRTLYSGAYITSLPSAQNRIQRGTRFYLPLSCSRDPGYDTYSGDFIEIAQSIPPAVVVVGTPYEGAPQPGQTGIGESDPEQPNDTIDITLETNEAITSGATLTEVDIVNTAGAFIQSGTSVTIMHPSSGVQEVVILTEDIDPDSTTMTFQSHVFAFSYPDASFILPHIDDGLMPTSLAQYYYFFKEGYTATEIYAPNFNFVDTESIGAHDINKRYNLHRGGIKMYYAGTLPSTPGRRINSFYFDRTSHTWKFWIGLEDETIEIEAF